MSSPRKYVLITGPFGLAMNDGLTHHKYIKMRTLVKQEVLNMLKDGPVTMLSAGLPWVGHIALDLMQKVKNDSLRLKIELPCGIEEKHTRDRKFGVVKFSGSRDGERFNFAHSGFHRETGIPSVLNIQLADKMPRVEIVYNSTLRLAVMHILKLATTAISFPTRDIVYKELLDEIKERNKEVIEFKEEDVNRECVVPQKHKLTILKLALSLLTADENDLMNKVSGDIYIDALKIINLATKIKKTKRDKHKPSPCITTPPTL